jgi:hypothetical protein
MDEWYCLPLLGLSADHRGGEGGGSHQQERQLILRFAYARTADLHQALAAGAEPELRFLPAGPSS